MNTKTQIKKFFEIVLNLSSHSHKNQTDKKKVYVNFFQSKTKHKKIPEEISLNVLERIAEMNKK